MTDDFPHRHTAHCESGTLSALLRRHGCDLDEAMVFGLGRALAFAYIPIVKLAGMPLISYRIPPGRIIANVCRSLNLRVQRQRFASPEKGMAALDAVLDAGDVAVLQTSVFWLPYFPAEMRFHFNAHNLLVYGKDGADYLISDPVFEQAQRCRAEDLQRARFAKGALAPKGLMYTLADAAALHDVPQRLPQLLRRAVAKNARSMLAPVFFVGVRGMRTLSRRLAVLPEKHDEAHCRRYLGHIVRMQEEIGTGGAGFRYLYACFLQQAADVCGETAWQRASQELTAIGDTWREFAADCVRHCRQSPLDGLADLAAQLHGLAQREERLWRGLAAAS
ncbi:BtrH N-terminal domain-containing protein [Conchiformibius kuhniae]|uniref:BtrH N-terminal domain-containing protein n=1 Tax=Conchiformibius kuhniae TaxID=211502 RepID=A0A8T9N0H6_9NEIS|nr:BtrH N-terminal domain-containing protein [Conchiformibius kuhniae]UOP05503.1 BtrH N-terminal domain-containing protein [Conchiformibius kuhniae]